MTSDHDSLYFGPALDIAAHSSIGVGAQLRDENQDNYLLIDVAGHAGFLRGQKPASATIDGWPAGHARVAVLDGMGGHGHGREAAEAVVEGLCSMPACTSLDTLSEHLDALHLHLQQRFADGTDPARRPGTTLTLLELPPGKPAMLYHVGDSRLYRVAAGVARPLTVDHVPATAFAMAGLLGEQEWWQQVHGEHRSQISQAFILGNAFTDPATLDDPLVALSTQQLPGFLAHLPDRRALPLEPGSDYLLATDGFWSCEGQGAWVARWPAVLGRAASASGACAALFSELADRPPPGLHSDNLTAIVLRVAPLPGTDETALPVA